MSKMPINPRGYSGKYSGSAGRNYSSSRAQMGRGGGTPPRKGCGGKKKIVAFLLLTGSSASAAVALAVAIARDLIG